MSNPNIDPVPISEEPTLDGTALDGARDDLDFIATDASVPIAEPIIDALPEGVPQQIGEYKLQRLIGEGGMGQVFLAEHVRMGRSVALKILPAARMKDPRAVDRFFEEIRAASRLLHPNIVTAFDAGESAGVHYMAMEYVDGATLTSLIQREGPMTVGEAASVIRQAAMGLLHAHRAGVVHRDVKPGNLMRASDGTIKVLDLGLAQVNSQQWSASHLARENDNVPRKQGRLIGTLSYMSPEQLEDPDSADARSDIYSLGGVLFFLLVGRAPYTGEFLDLVYGHRHGDVPELMQLRGDVDQRFDHIFRRMMAKSPEQRFGSLDEVIDELAEYAVSTTTPLWISEMSTRPNVELSTVSGGSTSRGVARVIGIDLGMFYMAAAEVTPASGIEVLEIDNEPSSVTRLAISGDGQKRFFGSQATARREPFPNTVIHCLPMYIGKPHVERALNGTKYPPEVLIAMSMRDLLDRAWKHSTLPDAAAVVVPSAYDQLHRRSILQASQLAGLKSVRLVDRSLAAAQSLVIRGEAMAIETPTNAKQHDELILFLGLTGQATDIAIIRQRQERMQQIATAGHWHTGTVVWLQALVKFVAERVKEITGTDPRKIPKSIAPLQVNCERAMEEMLINDRVRMMIPLGAKRVDIVVRRSTWLNCCDSILDNYLATIREACSRAAIRMDSIRNCLLLGPLFRVPEIRERLLTVLHPDTTIFNLEASDVARGAAACLSAELPGRGVGALPPRGVTSQTIGIVVEDARGRRRILPIIPRGSVLPARTNRRLTVAPEKSVMTLALVESSGIDGNAWHSLGRYTFEIDPKSNVQTRLLSFEVDVNGLLNVRSQSPPSPGSVKLPPIPQPMLDEAAFANWSVKLQSMTNS